MNQSVNQNRLHTLECQMIIFDDHGDSDHNADAQVDLASEACAPRDDPQKNLHQRQFVIKVDRSLRSLPEKHARAFMLRHGQEEETGDICDELGITRSNLHVILHRARTRLRTAMAA